jgi:hypothetical protein
MDLQCITNRNTEPTSFGQQNHLEGAIPWHIKNTEHQKMVPNSHSAWFYLIYWVEILAMDINHSPRRWLNLWEAFTRFQAFLTYALPKQWKQHLNYALIESSNASLSMQCYFMLTFRFPQYGCKVGGIFVTTKKALSLTNIQCICRIRTDVHTYNSIVISC